MTAELTTQPVMWDEKASGHLEPHVETRSKRGPYGHGGSYFVTVWEAVIVAVDGEVLSSTEHPDKGEAASKIRSWFEERM